jgi:membrane fusion protein (multidrug efflux system)
MAAKFYSPILLVIALLVALLVYLNWPQATQDRQARERQTPVKVIAAKLKQFPLVIEALGTALADESIIITAQETDIVQSIHFDDGDWAEVGQLLLTLNNKEEQANVNELTVNLEEATRQLKRLNNLAKKSATSQQLLDEQTARVKSLKARIQVAQAKLDQRTLRAPFSGFLGIRQVSVGALVRPGDSIATLDDYRQIKLNFSISEHHLPSVKLGQTVLSESAAYPDQVFEGEVVSIGSRIDPVTRAVQVRAVIDNPSLLLRPGMLLQVVLRKAILDNIVLPESALVPIDDKQYVFKILSQQANSDLKPRANKVEVEIGLRRPGWVQVLSGIQPDDLIVVEGSLRLAEGGAVNILEELSYVDF